jgi:methylmalonyl-CoA mutase C-terminal domain/subunit
VIRVLVGKPGLDGHDRGAKVIARALRDAGMEVIYTGLHQTPEMIVDSAIQEDVHVIALSTLSGNHRTVFPRVLELLKAQRADAIFLIGGGIIPDADAAELVRAGVRRIFGPGTDTREVVDYVKQIAGESSRRIA